jgi:hypothetical protein
MGVWGNPSGENWMLVVLPDVSDSQHSGSFVETSESCAEGTAAGSVGPLLTVNTRCLEFHTLRNPSRPHRSSFRSVAREPDLCTGAQIGPK